MRTKVMRHKLPPERLNDKELYLELQDTQRAMAQCLDHMPMGFEAAEAQSLWMDQIEARQEAVQAEIERRRHSRINTLLTWATATEGLRLIECSSHPFFRHEAPSALSPQQLLEHGRKVRQASPRVRVYQRQYVIY